MYYFSGPKSIIIWVKDEHYCPHTSFSILYVNESFFRCQSPACPSMSAISSPSIGPKTYRDRDRASTWTYNTISGWCSTCHNLNLRLSWGLNLTIETTAVMQHEENWVEEVVSKKSKHFAGYYPDNGMSQHPVLLRRSFFWKSNQWLGL